jgi:hypothetical protein
MSSIEKFATLPIVLTMGCARLLQLSPTAGYAPLLSSDMTHMTNA